MILDATKVPNEVVPLLPLAAKWGIGDDIDRELAVQNASSEELEQLAHCLDDIDVEALFDWLAGPEALSENSSNEYLAVTCLTMAIDSAKLKIRPE